MDFLTELLTDNGPLLLLSITTLFVIIGAALVMTNKNQKANIVVIVLSIIVIMIMIYNYAQGQIDNEEAIINTVFTNIIK